jgi:hypothetical protein
MLSQEDKQWIADLISSQIVGSEHRLITRIERSETALLEYIETRIERTETALLTEFHKWASPVEMRQRTHAAALRAIDTEMEALNDRVKKLEAS